MNPLQEAAKLLNENAPVDGQFGQERIAYLNPLEEEILKSIGGSGATIVPGVEEQGDPDVPSYGLFKWFKKKVMDDILGVDDNKTFGIKHKTFLGKGLGKVRDDILGIDSTKTFGISDATWDDLASTAVGLATGNPLAALAWTIGDKVVENNSGDTSGRQRQREELSKNAAAWDAARKGVGNMTDIDIANNRALAGTLAGRGKAGLIDPSDTAKIKNLLASPGDDAYIEGFSLGGQDLDAFPRWLRDAGDQINTTINDAGANMGEFVGTSQERMEAAQPTIDKLKSMSSTAIDQLGDIYDEDGVEAKYGEFRDRFQGLLDDQRNLNTREGERQAQDINKILASGDAYSQALRDAVQTEVDYTNRAYDAQLQGGLAGAAAQRANATNEAAANRRLLNRMGSAGGTGQDMASRMIGARMGADQTQSIADLLTETGRDRNLAIADINPGMGEVYGTKADIQNDLRRFGYGDANMQAEGANLGIDQVQLDDDRNFYDSLMNMRLGNTGLISSLGSQNMGLDNMYGEAAISPIGALTRATSPYTSTGQLPSPVASFNPAPAPATGGFSWSNTLRNLPSIIKSGREIANEMGWGRNYT